VFGGYLEVARRCLGRSHLSLPGLGRDSLVLLRQALGRGARLGRGSLGRRRLGGGRRHIGVEVVGPVAAARRAPGVTRLGGETLGARLLGGVKVEVLKV
jgi:hypothetical protein